MRGKKLTQEEFIKRAKEVHGNKYDYSKVEYKSVNKNVIIICPIHGEFEQMPREHLFGHGCQKCGKNVKRMSQEEFIKRAKEVHGNKYDYSKVEYVNYHTKVCIICPIHGEFWQKPSKHLNGQNCRKCSDLIKNTKENKKLTQEEFIKRAKEVHSNKYDYSKVEYVNYHTKVCIICPIHGEFFQTPTYHLNGNGCRKCADEMFKLTTEEFIKRAKEVHGDKYDYSKVEYVNSKTKICIICPIHGEFWQTPYGHLSGKGCDICGGSKKLTTEEFIKRAKEVHGDKYDYSKVEYVNNSTKVCIICKKHGEFWQTPNIHLSGCGCVKCNNSLMETKLYNNLCSFFKNMNFIHNYRNTKILKKQEIDIFNEEYRIGIEYQGLQHFKAIDYFGGEKKLKKQKENDLIKIEKCKENNITLLHFTYNENDIDDVIYKVYTNENELFNKIKKIIDG